MVSKILLDFRANLWYCCVLQRRCGYGTDEFRRTVPRRRRGRKVRLMGEVMKDFLQNGRPSEHDERTWLEMLLVKHALMAAEKMKSEGDTVSGMTDSVPPSSYVRWDENDNA